MKNYFLILIYIQDVVSMKLHFSSYIAQFKFWHYVNIQATETLHPAEIKLEIVGTRS